MATLRRNVVSYLYVVHCSIDGKKKKAFIKAESDATARAKALNEMMHDYPKAVDHQVIQLERIDHDEEVEVMT